MSSELHPFYAAYRDVNLGVHLPLLALYTLQLYWDRAELRVRAEWSKSHRVFRVGGFLGCLFTVIAHVDLFAVLGLYSLGTTSALGLMGLTFLWLPLVFSMYKAVEAVSTFLSPEERLKVKKGARFAAFLIGPVNMALVFAVVFTEHQAIGLLQSLTAIVWFVVLICGVNHVHREIKSCFQEVNSGLDRTNSSLEKAVRTWRNYAIAVTFLSFVMLVLLVARSITIANTLVNGIQFLESNLSRVSDPSKLPPMTSLALNFVQTFLIVLHLWRSWRTQDHTKSKSPNNKRPGGSSTVASTTTMATKRKASQASAAPTTPTNANASAENEMDSQAQPPTAAKMATGAEADVKPKTSSTVFTFNQGTKGDDSAIEV